MGLPAVPSRVVLGVSGGIAAYKACEVLRGLTESGHSVRVVPTRGALEFVGAATWAALSGQPVTTDVWDDVEDVPHVRLGQEADLVLVVPATADLMARAAIGRADDLLTATLLTARCPVVMAPAMHTEMWEHAATRANVETLRARGVVVLEPAVGRLTGADSGAGRLPEPAEILAVARRVLARGAAGAPTWRAGTSSSPPAAPASTSTRCASWATAAAVGRAGRWPVRRPPAAPRSPSSPPTSPSRTRPASRSSGCAAPRTCGSPCWRPRGTPTPSSWRRPLPTSAPRRHTPTKIKKDATGESPTDRARAHRRRAPRARRRAGRLARSSSASRPRPGTPRATSSTHGRAKLARKGCDLLVVNEVGEGRGFEVADNAAVILGADGSATEVPMGPKEALADVVWDAVARRRGP